MQGEELDSSVWIAVVNLMFLRFAYQVLLIRVWARPYYFLIYVTYSLHSFLSLSKKERKQI